MSISSGTGTPGSGNSLTVSASGIITSGTWNATLLASTYGGTGVNNSGRTLTLTNATTSGYILTSDGSGNATWAANAALGGVTSITGTSNQITASSSTGAVTLALASPLTMPGNLNMAGNSLLDAGVFTLGLSSYTGGTTSGIQTSTDISYAGDNHSVMFNAYYVVGPGTWTYFGNGYAALIKSSGGYGLIFETAPSGSLGGTISWNNTLTLGPTGAVGIGTLSPSALLDIENGPISGINTLMTINSTVSTTTAGASLYGELFFNNLVFGLGASTGGTATGMSVCCQLNIASGVTVNNATSLIVTVPTNSGAGAVTTAIGLRAGTPSIGTNNVAAYLDSLTVGLAPSGTYVNGELKTLNQTLDDGLGNAIISKTLAVGLGTVFYSMVTVGGNFSANTSGYSSGITCQVNFSPTGGAPSGSIRCIASQPSFTPISGTTISQAVSYYSSPNYVMTQNSVIASAFGICLDTGAYSGASGASITTGYGLAIYSIAYGTTQYGLYLVAPATGTACYGAYLTGNDSLVSSMRPAAPIGCKSLLYLTGGLVNDDGLRNTALFISTSQSPTVSNRASYGIFVDPYVYPYGTNVVSQANAIYANVNLSSATSGTINSVYTIQVDSGNAAGTGATVSYAVGVLINSPILAANSNNYALNISGSDSGTTNVSPNCKTLVNLGATITGDDGTFNRILEIGAVQSPATNNRQTIALCVQPTVNTFGTNTISNAYSMYVSLGGTVNSGAAITNAITAQIYSPTVGSSRIALIVSSNDSTNPLYSALGTSYIMQINGTQVAGSNQNCFGLVFSPTQSPTTTMQYAYGLYIEPTVQPIGTNTISGAVGATFILNGSAGTGVISNSTTVLVYTPNVQTGTMYGFQVSGNDTAGHFGCTYVAALDGRQTGTGAVLLLNTAVQPTSNNVDVYGFSCTPYFQTYTPGSGIANNIVHAYGSYFCAQGTASPLPAMTNLIEYAYSIYAVHPSTSVGTTASAALYTDDLNVGYANNTPPSLGAIIAGKVGIATSSITNADNATNNLQLGSIGNTAGLCIGMANSFFRMRELNYTNQIGLTTNINTGDVQDYPNISSWWFFMGGLGSDLVSFTRIAPGKLSNQTLLTLNAGTVYPISSATSSGTGPYTYTFTIGSQPYYVGQYVSVSGVTTVGYNGNYNVSAVTSTTFSVVGTNGSLASDSTGNVKVVGAVTTMNQTLDDGAGNMSVLGLLEISGTMQLGVLAPASSNYPYFQIYPYSHGNVQVLFDGYNSGSTPYSSYSNSTFRIAKEAYNLYFQVGVAAAGSSVSLTNVFSLGTGNTVATANNTLDDGSGNLTVATSVSTPVLKVTGGTPTVGYVLQCTNASTGASAWQPSAGGVFNMLFTSSSPSPSVTFPSTTVYTQIICIGGGGGGGFSFYSYAGGGGGGGGISIMELYGPPLSSTTPVTLSVGGGGTLSTSGNASYITTFGISAQGGSAGGSGGSSSGGGGGSGGLGYNYITGTVTQGTSGGTGGSSSGGAAVNSTGYFPVPTGGGGGGGFVSGPGGVGGTITLPTSYSGATAGYSLAGGSGTGVSGNAGTLLTKLCGTGGGGAANGNPGAGGLGGGGGGGATANSSGSAGGSGIIYVTYYFT